MQHTVAMRQSVEIDGQNGLQWVWLARLVTAVALTRHAILGAAADGRKNTLAPNGSRTTARLPLAFDFPPLRR